MPARRVLVPLLVLALAAALWLWPMGGSAPVVDLSDDVRSCADNLRALHAGLVAHVQRTGQLPAGSGPALLAGLIGPGGWVDEPATRARLVCPGAHTPYAARDTAVFPLPRFPAGGPEREPVAGCDSTRALAHAGCTNVLYSDGSVVTLVLAQEIERRSLPAGATTIGVGRGAELAELRKLKGQEQEGPGTDPALDR